LIMWIGWLVFWVVGCGVSSMLLKYFGLSLEASYKAKHIWDGVIEKIEH